MANDEGSTKTIKDGQPGSTSDNVNEDGLVPTVTNTPLSDSDVEVSIYSVS